MRRSFLTFCVIHLEYCVCCAHKRTLARFFSFVAYRIAEIRFTISFECMVWYVCDQLLSARRVSISFFLLLLFCCCSLSFVTPDTKIERQKKKNTSPTTTTSEEE